MSGFDIRTIPKPVLSSYQQRAKSLFGSSLLAYWPLNETSGTVATDVSGNGRNGAYSATGVTLSNATSITGNRAPLFNTGDINAYSASLAGAFSGAEGGVFGTAKMSAGSVWTDATARYLFFFQADASNRVYLRRDTGNNALLALYAAGGTTKQYPIYLENTAWFTYAVTWSKAADTVDFYINGAKLTTLTGLGIWAGALHSSFVRIGSFGAGANTHSGWYGDVGVVNRKITADEARILSTGQLRARRIAILGDSISSVQSTPLKWPYLLGNLGHGGNYLGIMNHAVSGQSIIGHMDAQVVATANDNADEIYIMLGTNDDNAGNMATLQAEAEENIAELKVSNPNAVITWINVLPRWTDSTGATPVDKSNIRTAISAACTAQGITCISPTITAAQTADGLHPTSAGQAVIANDVIN